MVAIYYMRYTAKGRDVMATRQILIRLDDLMVERLDEAASSEGVSRAEWIRRACGRVLEEPEDTAGAGIPALLEKVAGLEALLDSNRARLADSQAHSIDLKTELDAGHQQQGALTILIETMREHNQTLIRALPAATTKPKRSWRDRFRWR